MRRLLAATWIALSLSACVAFGGDEAPGDAGRDAARAAADAARDAADGTRDGAADASFPADATRDAADGASASDDAGRADAAPTADGAASDAADASDGSVDAGDAGIDARAPAASPRLELGTSVPDGVFVAFTAGDAIPISSAGQSGVVLDLALRSYDMPADLFLTVRVTPDGGEPLVVRQPGTTPDSFTCGPTHCELLPFRVAASALGAPLDVVGMMVRVQVAASDGVDLLVAATHDGPLQAP